MLFFRSLFLHNNVRVVISTKGGDDNRGFGVQYKEVADSNCPCVGGRFNVHPAANSFPPTTTSAFPPTANKSTGSATKYPSKYPNQYPSKNFNFQKLKPIFLAVVPQPMTNSSWEDEDELQTPTVEEQNFPDSKVLQLQCPSKITHHQCLLLPAKSERNLLNQFSPVTPPSSNAPAATDCNT